MRARTDLSLVGALALLALLGCALLPSSLDVLRIPAAGGLVLVLPGYALAAAHFAPDELRRSERVLLSIVLSLVATILAALLLQLVGVRLKTAPWMGLLALLAVGASAAGTVRGHARSLGGRLPAVRGVHAAGIAAAVALLAGAAVLAFRPLGAPRGLQGATFVWVLPHGPASAAVGVISDTTVRQRVLVQVRIGSGRPRSLGPVALAPGATWTRVIAIGAGRPRVLVVLRSAANPTTVLDTAIWRTGRAAP